MKEKLVKYHFDENFSRVFCFWHFMKKDYYNNEHNFFKERLQLPLYINLWSATGNCMHRMKDKFNEGDENV